MTTSIDQIRISVRIAGVARVQDDIQRIRRKIRRIDRDISTPTRLVHQAYRRRQIARRKRNH